MGDCLNCGNSIDQGTDHVYLARGHCAVKDLIKGELLGTSTVKKGKMPPRGPLF
jgi:hypothetical protein